MQNIIDHKYGKIALGLISFAVISALPALVSQGAPNPAGSVLPGASWLLQWVLVIAITREISLVLLTPFLPAEVRIWNEQSIPMWARQGATAFGFITAVLYAVCANAFAYVLLPKGLERMPPGWLRTTSSALCPFP